VIFSFQTRPSPGVQARQANQTSQEGQDWRAEIKTSPAEVTQIKLAGSQAEPSAIGLCILRQPFHRSVAVTQHIEVLVVVVVVV
jgi:hypothetical protein